VHLATVTDGYGFITEQVIGQTDIALTVEAAQLTDDDPATATPAGIVIAADHGGVVQAVTGETVMIGAGALAQDTSIGIRRIAIDDLADGPSEWPRGGERAANRRGIPT